jgi:hypothetical protein
LKHRPNGTLRIMNRTHAFWTPRSLRSRAAGRAGATAFVAFLLAPPLLAFMAEPWLRWSFGLGLPLVLVSLAMSGMLAARPSPAATQAA